MATRVLQAPRHPQFNLRVYQDNGSLLAALFIPTDRRDRYILPGMLLRYCSSIFIFPNQNEWAIYKLQSDGTPGPALRHNGRAVVDPGNYIVMDQDKNPITVNLTSNSAPHRVRTHDPDTQSQVQRERDRLQTAFRNTLCQRDGCCVISGQARTIDIEHPFRGLGATHVFPVSMIEEWRRNGYRQYITDTRPSSEIGGSGLFSAQNGLLLREDIHTLFDDFLIGIDPDAGYKIIVFGNDGQRIGGTRLKSSARSGADRVSPDLLRWHLRMCLYRRLKANPEPDTLWEEDLGEDPMGSILRQPDAAERMEVELFTRLGGLVA
ncbi:hypothetical protein N7489_006898 [Penicillium chrysogenum]|uniref:HNH nuclease domain-containing protein n=1 Tax=Penicillium chrysogenum TaxID=5076 RepID=A0ABQ8W4W1_PENCH|nr:uncharacterized protein N7489_006898 [Penicillium chrysogenum]KAJ5236807.1 hypothetical protein N7489_006898 [Penicillium chrysogenum]KAJ5255707.1 hypothetical protein N7505_010858 [Penicillium chrysogenum]KAJ5276772.1 hypothetical protein N7524_002925 [Penicillium chrysogenum]KAJ6152486.1 hypothetical protein N7497_006805 [Penicillium chrysogenum]